MSAAMTMTEKILARATGKRAVEPGDNVWVAADILMTSVLRLLRHTDLLDEHPVLVAYKERCEARPAFAKALAGQMAAFR